jgi:hypothetical protein
MGGFMTNLLLEKTPGQIVGLRQQIKTSYESIWIV